MKWILSFVLLAMLGFGTLTEAHVPSPKLSCESAADVAIHDYGLAIPGGGVLYGFLDGSAGQSCTGPAGDAFGYCLDQECAANCWAGGLWIRVVIFCAGPSGADGHHEFAVGGAILLAENSSASTCWGEAAHHPAFGTISVSSSLSTLPVSFTVGADALNNLPAGDPTAPGCGDGEMDALMECIDFCTVFFPPGLDGAYHVQALGGAGHVWTS